MPRRKKNTLLAAAKVYGPAAILTLAAFLLAYQFVDPAPPKRLAIATGSEQGAYAGFASRYRDILARQGIELEIHHTRGSMENLELLSSGQVDVAFVQGGTEQAATAPLYSLGSLYFEPAWLFYRAPRPVARLTDLPSLRIAIGAPGSGTLALARTLLRDNRLAADRLQVREIGGRKAADALKNGALDAAFFVSGVDSPLISELIQAPGIRLMSFRRATAYTRLHPFLSEVVLPEGVLDMLANVPDRDIHLLAPAATLVTTEQTHPALQDLLLQSMSKVHGDSGWFAPEQTFPSPRFSVFPLSPEAARFYQHGPPFLQRYLPFWAATLVDRLKVMLLPLVVILLPLMKVMPPIYTWRMRSRIYRLYSALEALETRIGPDMSDQRWQACLDELGEMEEEVRKVHVPLPFAAQAYDLRQHIRLVRERLLAMRVARESDE